MKRTKYWRRNGGFTLSPEVKVSLLIDSHITCMQSTETTFNRGTMLNETLLIEESDTDESSDSLRPIGTLYMHSCSAEHFFVCFLSPATLAYPILPDQLQEITELRKNYLFALSALRNTSDFWRFARKCQEVKGSKLSLH